MGNLEKICSMCGAEYIQKRINQNFCSKKCAKKSSSHTYYIKNKEKINTYTKKWAEENPDKIQEMNKDWYKKNSERAINTSKKWAKENPDKLWQVRNRETHNEKCKKSNKKNRVKIQAQRLKRYREDVEFRIITIIRGRINSAVKNQSTSKKAKSTELLGCTGLEAKQYLESKFQEGMSWDNYGYGNDKWNIDHIIPVSSFDHAKEEEQRKCFHYTNLQPLWQVDNFKKGSKIING